MCVFSASLRFLQAKPPAMALAGCFTGALLPITHGTSASLRSTLSESSSLKKWTAASATNARTPATTATTAFLHDCKVAGSQWQSRRSVVQTGGLLGLLAMFDRLPDALAEDEDGNGESGTSSSTTTTTATASKPVKAVVDTETWYGYRGEGFRMTIPPDFEDIVEYDDSGTSLYGERAKVKPFAARFASPDRKEVLSVVVRNGSQMRLSFLQTQDITEFGSLEEAAKVFVPAGSKIVAAAALKPTDSRVLRTYYLYEFLARDGKRVVMSAAAAGGRVFVFGAMAPNSMWKEVGSRMRSAAVKFALM